MSIYNKPILAIDSIDLQELLEESAREGLRLEFKEQQVNRDKTLKEITGFANTYGGYLIIGAKENPNTRQVESFPGLDQSENSVKSFAQTITQWCTEGVYPPLQPFISNPIASPDNPERVCFVIYLEASEEAPHFINGRNGCYVRTEDLNHLLKPMLANYEEIAHLANRRELLVNRTKIITILASRADFITSCRWIPSSICPFNSSFRP